MVTMTSMGFLEAREASFLSMIFGKESGCAVRESEEVLLEVDADVDDIVLDGRK